MEVILLERLGKLGGVGDTVRVKDGYARNFLIPRKKALRATEANKQVFDERRHVIEEENAKKKADAETQAKKFDKLTVTLVRQASEEGKLYGSVTVRDVGDGLKVQGHEVPRSQIVLTSTIKTTGTYPARIVLHPEVICEITLSIVRSEAEAAQALENGQEQPAA